MPPAQEATATARRRPATMVAVRKKPRVWDTMLIVALTMVAFFSWQLSSDPGLGGMYLDALCEDGKARECAIDLVGERVAIRGLSASKDLDRLFEMKSAPGVADYQLYDPPRNIMEAHGNFMYPYIASQARKSLIPRLLLMPWYPTETRNRRVVAITRKSDKNRELVGIVGVYGYYDRHRPVKEIHYELHPSVWRLGYMTEALSLVLEHLFKELRHPVEAVTASIFPDNVASEGLLKKLWFTYDHSLQNGMQVYKLSKERWARRRAQMTKDIKTEAPKEEEAKKKADDDEDVEDA